GEGGAAGDEHLVYFAGVGVGAAELDRAQAGAVVLSDRPHRVAGGGVGHPVRPGLPVGGRHAASPPSIAHRPGAGANSAVMALMSASVTQPARTRTGSGWVASRT